MTETPPSVRSESGPGPGGTTYPPAVEQDGEVPLEGAEGAPSMQLSSLVDQDVAGPQDNGLLVVLNDQPS